MTWFRFASGVTLRSEVAAVFHQASQGDFRVVKRDLGSAVRAANAGKGEITVELAKRAVKAGKRDGN